MRESRLALVLIPLGAIVVFGVWWVFGVVWAWIAVSAIGAVLSGILVNESRQDLLALPNKTNGRRVAAWSRAIREFLRITVHVPYIGSGLIVLGILPLSRELVVPILMWGNVVLVINSLVDWRTRWLLFQTRDHEPTIPH